MITDNNKIARNKLKSNVAEFIIYMYQMEDLCRVYNFNLEDISEYVVRHFPVEKQEKEDLVTWFRDLSAQMKSEEIQERGHLKEVQAYVDELLAIKNNLLPSNPEFAGIYNHARPHIRKAFDEALSHGQRIENDIQVCLNGIYGLLLCRMNGKEVPEELNESLDAFGLVLSHLSYEYRKQHFMGEN